MEGQCGRTKGGQKGQQEKKKGRKLAGNKKGRKEILQKEYKQSTKRKKGMNRNKKGG